MRVLDILATKAEQNGLQFIVIGGHAVNAYGERRQTGDLDILVREDDRHLWESFLTSMGYILFHRHKVFLQFRPPDLEVWPIDIMLVDDRTFEGLFAESEEVNFGGTTNVRIPSIEHLIALKLNVLKQVGKARELKDLADIVALVKIGRLDVKDHKFKLLCKKYGTINIYEKIVDAVSA
ncbi:MAG: nucleotidyltransferase [Deltaproteobacteria bacterium]|nr:nucleotidyltransferase [Deltaproteobacteria bacterium]